MELSEDLHYDRKDRIGQIQWERKDPRLERERLERERLERERPRLALEGPSERRGNGGYEEWIKEREIVYEDGSRRRYRVP